jgi:hypothetical protein
MTGWCKKGEQDSNSNKHTDFISIDAFLKKKKLNYIYINISSSILFTKLLLNNIDFSVMRLSFGEVFLIHLWFCFYLLCR